MRSLTFVGLILLVISAILFYLTTDFNVEEIKLSHIMGIMGGIGIGLIFGGLVGYASKGSAIRNDQKNQELKQLRKEKEDYEKEKARLEKEQAKAQAQANANDPRIF